MTSDNVVPFRSDECQLKRIAQAVGQYRNAPFRSADWLAGELMTILDTAPANDAAPHRTERGL